MIGNLPIAQNIASFYPKRMNNMLEPNSTCERLLRLLSDGIFHSGENLGNELGITRSAIWKARKQLEGLNVNIESITGKGYRIPGGIELLSREVILEQLSETNREALYDLHLLPTIDSTNNYLLNYARRKAHIKVCAMAEQQTHGRGRCHNEWHSPFGRNIYMSLVWHFVKDPTELLGFNLVVCIAMCRTLIRLGIQKHLSIKWPNDVYYGTKKLGAVLTETIAELNSYSTAIIGIGLNTFINDTLSLHSQWTDLNEISTPPPQRNVLAGMLLDEVMSCLRQYDQSGLKAFHSYWPLFSRFHGCHIELQSHTHLIKGTYSGIDKDTAELMIKTDDKIVKVSSGHIIKLKFLL